jgi:hypothetical protein
MQATTHVFGDESGLDFTSGPQEDRALPMRRATDMTRISARKGTMLFAVAAFAVATACGDEAADPTPDAATPNDSGAPDASTEGSADAGLSDASTDDPDVPPVPMTVNGTVRYGEGSGMPGITAYVAGSAPVVSDDDGVFVIEGVTAPYDLLLVSVDENSAVLYAGLESEDPSITFPFGPMRHIGIEGTLVAGVGAGFTTTTPVDGRTEYTFRSQNGIQRKGSGSVASPFDFDARWVGPPAVTRTLHVFQYEVVDGVADAFLGYGSIPIGLVNGGSIDVGAVTMDAITDRRLAGTVSAPAGITIVSIGTGCRLPDGTSYSPDSQETGPAFDQVVPGVAGATGSVLVQLSVTTDAGPAGAAVVRTGLALPSTDLEIAVPLLDVPQVVSPAIDGELSPGTELVLTGAEGTVRMMILRPHTLPSDGGTLVLVTRGDRAVVPDTAPFGVALSSSETYDWQTVAFLGVGSVDDFVANDVYARLVTSDIDGTLMLAPDRTLVTLP